MENNMIPYGLTKNMNRVNLINFFIRKYNFQKYLELGSYDKSTFNNIISPHKTSVDLKHNADYIMTTDKFFEVNEEKYDIIFIDADHRERQLDKDIFNSLKILNKGGVIVCHDCNPPSEHDQIEENFLYQTAWKSFTKCRTKVPYLTFCINDDCGLGVIDTSESVKYIDIVEGVDYENLQYKDLENYRNILLNLVNDISDIYKNNNATKVGWLVNNALTAIPGTKTFWHDLLEWIPNLEDKTFGYTDFSNLANVIENELSKHNPDYIIRNASYFRKINSNGVKTISLLQDIYADTPNQLDVCNNSDVTVLNTEYTLEFYKNKITSRIEIIPLGVDFKKFIPLENKQELKKQFGLKEDTIIFVGSSNNYPKGFNIIEDLIENTKYNFCLVMKDSYSVNTDGVKTFNRVDHDTLVKLYNACDLLLCTSVHETQHLSGIEAAACNIPIVTTNVGIYYGMEEDGWGRKLDVGRDYTSFIEPINHVLHNRDKFNPRENFLSKKLDTNDCKEKWIKLINEL